MIFSSCCSSFYLLSIYLYIQQIFLYELCAIYFQIQSHLPHLKMVSSKNYGFLDVLYFVSNYSKYQHNNVLSANLRKHIFVLPSLGFKLHAANEILYQGNNACSAPSATDNSNTSKEIKIQFSVAKCYLSSTN